MNVISVPSLQSGFGVVDGWRICKSIFHDPVRVDGAEINPPFIEFLELLDAAYPAHTAIKWSSTIIPRNLLAFSRRLAEFDQTPSIE
jgi:hypothetical protein